MEELTKENERLKKSLAFVAEKLEYTYDICEKYPDPWLTICTGNCYNAFMTDFQLMCQECLKYYCNSCWKGSECTNCNLSFCDKCHEACPNKK